jgi:phytoene dehydrogenase-like protein
MSPQFSRRIKNIKMRGATARVHYGLKELPNFDGLHEESLKGIVSISPSLSYIEKASDASKYGRISEEPWIEFTVSSLREKSFAPAGKHVLSATVQYAPYHLRGTDWQSARDKLGNRVSDILEKYASGFRSLIEHQEVLTPEDLESRFRLTEGNLNQGEMMLDQFFFMRPTIDSAQYLAPIGNLYLCGAATHPGGGLHCTNGYNAANEIIKQLQSL